MLLFLAALSNSSWMRIITMVCSTIMVIVAGCVAASVSNRESRQWWAVLGVLALAAMIVWVAYTLFSSGYYASYDPA